MSRTKSILRPACGRLRQAAKMRQKQPCFEDDPQPRVAHTKTIVRSSEQVSSTHRTKYWQLWITEFSRSKRTAVLVAKETADQE